MGCMLGMIEAIWIFRSKCKVAVSRKNSTVWNIRQFSTEHRLVLWFVDNFFKYEVHYVKVHVDGGDGQTEW